LDQWDDDDDAWELSRLNITSFHIIPLYEPDTPLHWWSIPDTTFLQMMSQKNNGGEMLEL